MPEIGATLREARMRAKIDITEVEQATKIRAKYLRALENEEWSLLPAPTFIKSFLREYADFLGLDARTLVEEYKLRYERPSEQELTPISPKLGRERRGVGARTGSYGPPRTAPPWMIVGGAVVLLLVVLGLVGVLFGGGGGGGGNGGTTSTRAAGTQATGTTTQRAPAAAPARASVQIVPTGTVYVCLVGDRGRVLIRGAQFSAGQSVPVYRARKLRLTLGNNAVELRVNGKPVSVPASSQAIAYEITRAGAQPLPLSQAPTCT
ncbi:MAG TPA: helix-turn-helix domain-containing protein [Conexibacter sp.]|nr:helix-turn-helix domain-containing protein [Conexibacter sp.]